MSKLAGRQVQTPKLEVDRYKKCTLHTDQIKPTIKLSAKLKKAIEKGVLLSVQIYTGDSRDILSTRATWITCSSDITLDISGYSLHPIYYTFKNSELWVNKDSIYLLDSNGQVFRFKTKMTFVDKIIPKPGIDAKRKASKQEVKPKQPEDKFGKFDRITNINIKFDEDGQAENIRVTKLHDGKSYCSERLLEEVE